MDTKINHEESLALINEMIHQARNNFQKERTHPIMLFWGYLVTCIALANSVLLHILSNPHYSYWVWLVTIPGMLVSYFIRKKVNRKELVKTHIDNIGNMLWRGYLIGIYVFLVAIYILAFRMNSFSVMLIINPVILSIIGICEFVSARIYRYKPWYWVAVIFWLSALICAFLNVDLQFIVLAICMLFGFVIPGHLLNYQAKKSHV